MYLRPSLGLILITLTCLQVFGLYLFLKGFLLTRQTFHLEGQKYSSWERFPVHSKQNIPSFSPTPPPPIINSQKPFKRTIVILIDALRFDFVLDMKQQEPRYFRNQFPILHQLQSQGTGLLFQFRADPPTTTMQRVKGIMTGSLPTFIDAGSNFASSSVSEDHLLRHIVKKYPALYFMGDDTWVNLFPESFQPNRTFESDSFKMLDLDSVDNDILKHLWPLMEENSEWQVAIAHFLGVDHCGHTYGPSDPNMALKLNQMNGVIERLTQYVDEDTLLVVMGDHGMSVEGDHGGESVEELMSTLFMYSKRTLKMKTYDEFYDRIHRARSDRLGYDLSAISQRLQYDARQYPIVAQIHLVPTLAYLLQVPIPFGNLGALIPEVLSPEAGVNGLARLLHMVQEFRTNALQVYDYLTQYGLQTHQLDFSPDQLKPILDHFFQAEEKMVQLLQQEAFLSFIHADTVSEEALQVFGKALEEAVLEYDAFLISTIKYCEAIWAQFDTGCMFIGIVVLGLSTFISFWVMQDGPQVRLKRAVVVSVSVLLMCWVLRSTIGYDGVIETGWFEKMERMDWVGASVAVTVCCISMWMKPSLKAPESVFWYDCDWYLLLIADIAQSFTLGSNSYVIWEDRGTLFGLGSLCVCWAARELKGIERYSKESVMKAVGYPSLFFLVVRVTSLTGQCREEQFPDCDYVYSHVLEFGNHAMGYMTIGLIGLSLGLIRLGSKRLKDGLIQTMYQLSGLIVVLKMVQEIYFKNTVLERTGWLRVFEKCMDVYLPRVVYGMCLLGTMMTMMRREESKHEKGWKILLLWSTVLAIVQRPFSSMIVLGSPILVDLVNRGTKKSLLIRLGILHFLGHHLFFVTGHQATFTSLPWKAAFVGFDEMNYYGGMILVTLSTIAGYIVSWLGMFIVLTKVTEKLRLPFHFLILLQSIPTFLCAIFILILRRHLMTWKIFAPRFLVQILIEVGAHLAVIALEKAL